MWLQVAGRWGLRCATPAEERLGRRDRGTSMKVSEDRARIVPAYRRALLMFDRLELVRRLIPAYELKGSVFCWQCSVCRKLFTIETEKALAGVGPSEPAEVQHDFRAHDCRMQFATTLERLERQS